MKSRAREWEDINPGQCKHVQLPSATLSLSICVLDAPLHFTSSSSFAAILVPQGQEFDWVFCAPNGLWDLLFSACVSRLVVLRRLSNQCGKGGKEEGEHFCVHPQIQALSLDTSLTDCMNFDDSGDDASFKESLIPLLHCLFPWSIHPQGPAPDPYVTYEDNVLARVILEIKNDKDLGGGILVEDVELDCTLGDDTSIVDERRRIFRRRMRFWQMPNLIQTEVPIAIYSNGQLTSLHGLEDVKAFQKKHACTTGLENGGKACEIKLEVRLDHTKLVHKYLPPIVAGLVLASPCLGACMAADVRAKVLAIGLGGGALPIFLHRHFGFCVLAVDTNKIVVELARSHFGLVHSEHLQVQVKDGMDMVFSIAHQVCESTSGSAEISKHQQEPRKDLSSCARQGKIISGFEPTDARMHAIIVDVNVDDARSGLLSPPPCFLSEAFLRAVVKALHEGGMLVINVMVRTKKNFNAAVSSLRNVFSGIYQIQIEDNYVLFAFPSKIADIDMGSVFALRVANAVGHDLFEKIEEIEDSIDVYAEDTYFPLYG